MVVINFTEKQLQKLVDELYELQSYRHNDEDVSIVDCYSESLAFIQHELLKYRS